jgi:hypothetical protein
MAENVRHQAAIRKLTMDCFSQKIIEGWLHVVDVIPL